MHSISVSFFLFGCLFSAFGYSSIPNTSTYALACAPKFQLFREVHEPVNSLANRVLHFENAQTIWNFSTLISWYCVDFAWALSLRYLTLLQKPPRFNVPFYCMELFCRAWNHNVSTYRCQVVPRSAVHFHIPPCYTMLYIVVSCSAILYAVDTRCWATATLADTVKCEMPR